MSRSLCFAAALVVLTALPAAAQMPFPADLVPKRESLARLGLERQWMVTVPLVNEEQVLLVSHEDDFIFAQTNKANFHVYNAETGERLWSANLGTHTARARPASVNSYAVFVTNFNRLFALDRKTGRTIWSEELGTLPSSATACDEERVVVGLFSGKVICYGMKKRDKKTNEAKLSDKALSLWNWQTNKPVETRPILAEKLVAFGSDDGKVYVALNSERTLLYRIATGGAIGSGFGASGTRLLVAPSSDNNLYGIDLLTSKVKWVFPSAAPIKQEPLVAGDDIFAINASGMLFSIDPKNGESRWSTSTHDGKLLAVGEKRLYLETFNDDLIIVDRATGQTVADGDATYKRAGLNLRPFELGPTNRDNDRLYFGTASGMIVCIRETGQVTPRATHDPKEKPFGYIPPEGLINDLFPKVAPPAEATGDTPPATDNPMP